MEVFSPDTHSERSSLRSRKNRINPNNIIIMESVGSRPADWQDLSAGTFLQLPAIAPTEHQTHAAWVLEQEKSNPGSAVSTGCSDPTADLSFFIQSENVAPGHQQISAAEHQCADSLADERVGQNPDGCKAKPEGREAYNASS